VHSALCRVTLPKDVARCEANRANNEWLRALRQWRQAWSAAQVATFSLGEETPSEPKSSGGGDKVGGWAWTSSPHPVTSSASRRGSPLVCVSQNAPG
jgi:hypothetical protein